MSSSSTTKASFWLLFTVKVPPVSHALICFNVAVAWLFVRPTAAAAGGGGGGSAAAAAAAPAAAAA